MTSTNSAIHVPQMFKRGALKPDDERYLDSGAHLLRRIPEWLGLDNLAESEILDVGCGTKFTEAIFRDDIAIRRYVGVDVYRPMIEHLTAEVKDPRFAYFHMDTHNEMYNPNGEPLNAATPLPCPDQYFDIICLFSVFTHLAPHDFTAMMRVLRPYAKPDARLVFSLYLDELTPGGFGLIDTTYASQGVTEWTPSTTTFRDAYPGKPLQWALYAREYAIELAENTGWEIESINDPEQHVQHFFVCRPGSLPKT